MTQPVATKEMISDEKTSSSSRSTEVIDATNVDEAQDIVLNTVNAEYTEADYKRVVRKIDRILLPFMWLCAGIQQADKASISSQATFGLPQDTHLVGQQFSWLTTAFYISYLIGEAPSNYLMQRFGVNKPLFISLFLWGVVVLCIAFAQNFTQLVALRSLQGLLECSMAPALVLLTASFYVSREHPMKSVIWSTSNSGLDIITQLVMYGIGSTAQKHTSSFGPWRWISVFLGSWTIVMSFFSLLFLGTLSEVRWLSKEEKRIAAARVASSQIGSDRGQKYEWHWDQVVDAFRDPQTYFFFFAYIANSLPNSGTAAFGNLVFVSFGFTNLETIVKCIIPLDLVTIAWLLVVGILTLKWPHTRFLLMIISTIPGFVGLLALGLLPTEAGRTKKSVIGTVMFIAYCVGGAVGPQTFRAEWAPRYIPAIILCGIMYGVVIALFIAWRFYYIMENKRRAKTIKEMGMTPEQSAHQGKINGESDMTDRQNIHFKYSM
ncbi:major facilitator superfamily domain-containing protein [Trichoderma breve]|uniref:Major facilitator superfamily domain-containing protein n=1 Tax=Trichoderma breve TaxID=2034170 RepID=A0A9W9JQY3_9HYPO|nr:major facilitator superfamily domain-containing protein [Trichoderma breve]KAJ4864448.1 major facilitator superfamily domain-containing protein [Trichoderma breve]